MFTMQVTPHSVLLDAVHVLLNTYTCLVCVCITHLPYVNTGKGLNYKCCIIPGWYTYILYVHTPFPGKLYNVLLS